MKKLIKTMLLLAITSFALPTFAVIDSDRLLNEDYLRNSGYSPETIRMINLKRIDPYAPYEKKEVKQNPVSWVKRFYQYMDPATDNQRFGEGIIDPRLDRPSQL
ncbi:hypothetical protein IJE86_03725 [bacterium]|nr:hypothetical protein [bacterium]